MEFYNDRGIAGIVRQEVEYMKLINLYNKTFNPSLLKEIERKFSFLCRAWDSVRVKNK